MRRTVRRDPLGRVTTTWNDGKRRRKRATIQRKQERAAKARVREGKGL